MIIKKKPACSVPAFFSSNFTYDSYGRLSTLTHPSGIVETMNYNGNGYLSSISAGGATRFTITGMNAREQLTGSTYGTSLTATYGFDAYGYPASASVCSVQDYRYSFDPVTGNLNSRQNYLQNRSETFTYDNLDRLTNVTGPQNLTTTFENNGNISTKSDIGTTDFEYGTNAGPYALTRVTSTNTVIPVTSQSASYTSFQKVSAIGEGDYSATFIYNADQQRAKMNVTQGGTNILTRWYPGSRYMKETAGSVTREFTYLGGDAYQAPVVAVTQSGTTTYYYLLRDHLGNITHQVNTSNSVVAEYSFDAWGRRRNPADWSYSLTGQPELFAGRGFTGHEHLPWFNLINMNGRLYDPLVGRFLSSDNFVQDPSFTQSYNRYSYCWNNPLKYTDPNGYRLYMRNMEQSDDDHSGGNWEPNIYTRGGGGSYDLPIGAGAGAGWYSAYIDAVNKGYTVKMDEFKTSYDNSLYSQDYNGDISFTYTYYTSISGIDKDGFYCINKKNTETVTISASELGINTATRRGFGASALTFTDKHFNGGLGTVGVSVQGYNKIPNNIKRAYAYKLSKMTGVKSGQIFQGAKGFVNGTGKLVSKLGPVGTILGVGVISYEVGYDMWDAHTIVNGSLMVGAGVATFFAAPAVLTGIAIYGVGDYIFGFGDIIDNNIGRYSGAW